MFFLGIVEEKLKSWEEVDRTFITTNAAEHVMKLIQRNSCVIVTGNAGVGKTSAVIHAALQLQKQEYIIVPISRPENIMNVYNKVPKTVFVIDDLCGRYTLNQQYLDNVTQVLNDIKTVLENCKILATCRIEVFKDERFKGISKLEYVQCDFNSKDICLTHDEKKNLANAYFKEDKNNFVQLYAEFDCFPFLCKLLSMKAIASLPHNPFDYFKEELDGYLLHGGDEKGKYKYCAMSLIVMFNNKLDKKYLKVGRSKTEHVSEIITNTLEKCKLNTCTSLENIKDALGTLDGYLVVKGDGVYRMIHDKLFDYVAYYFGNKMLELFIKYSESDFIRERFIWKSNNSVHEEVSFTIMLPDHMLQEYIYRMIDDWEKGYCVDVFANRNMKNKDFISDFLNCVKTKDRPYQLCLAKMEDCNNGDTSLLQSCFVGNADLTTWISDCLIDNGRISVIEQCRRNGTSPVYIACQEGHLEILNRLIECKADINKCCDDGTSPVYATCHEGHLEILNRLIECKADINKCNNNGASPVYIACQTGHLEILNRLIECKADKNKCCDDGSAPVHIACYNGYIKILNRLIECGADINKCTDNGLSPVYIACYNGHLKILNRLIECKADINKCINIGTSPAHVACMKGHLQILNSLIAGKADINKAFENGKLPLDFARANGHFQIVEMLKKANE